MCNHSWSWSKAAVPTGGLPPSWRENTKQHLGRIPVSCPRELRHPWCHLLAPTMGVSLCRASTHRAVKECGSPWLMYVILPRDVPGLCPVSFCLLLVPHVSFVKRLRKQHTSAGECSLWVDAKELQLGYFYMKSL